MAEYTPCPPETPTQLVNELPEIPESTSVNCTGDVEYHNCFPDVCATITEQPESQTIDEGEDTEFSVAGTVTIGEVAFQWQYSDDEGATWIYITDTGIYSGANTDTLTLEDVTPETNGFLYRCILSNLGCEVLSGAAVLFVAAFCPTITLQPTPEEIFYGEDTEFVVAGVVSLGIITYQWQANDGGGWDDIGPSDVYNGTDTDTLTLTFPPEELSGYLYRCVLSKIGCEDLFSDSAELTVASSCPEIIEQPVPQEIFEGYDAEFFIVASVPFGVVSYQWQVNDGGGWDDVIDDAVYSGATTDTLTLTEPPIELSEYLFRCVLSNLGCEVTSDEVELLVDAVPCPEITEQPEPTTITEGDDAEFTVAAEVPIGDIDYQWQVNDGGGWDNIVDDSLYSGAETETLSITEPPFPMDGYLFRCVVSNACEVTSDEVELTVEEVPIGLVTSYRSKSSTATLCGYSEYTSPSSPPKKYLVKSLTGIIYTCTYGANPGCNPINLDASLRDDFNGAQCSYNPATCVLTRNVDGTRYITSLGVGPCPLVSGGASSGYDLDCSTLFPFNASSSTRMQTPTTSTVTGTGVCASVAGPVYFKQTGSVTETLSSEDTESDAILRANGSVGYDGSPASIAKIETRGAGDFSSTYVYSEARETMTNLVVGRNYQLSITYGRRTYGSMGAFTSYSILDVFFTAATNPENSAYIALPNDSGFETNILSVTCVSV